MNPQTRRAIGAAMALLALANFVLGLAGDPPLKAWLCIQRPDVADPCSGLYPLTEILVLLGFFIGVYLLLTGAGDYLEP